MAAAAGSSAQGSVTSLGFERLALVAVWRTDVDVRAEMVAVTVMQAAEGEEHKAGEKRLRSRRHAYASMGEGRVF